MTEPTHAPAPPSAHHHHHERPHGQGTPTGPDPFAGAAERCEPFAGGAHALVITCSDRAAAGAYEDQSGQVAADTLTRWGYRVTCEVVGDGTPVRQAISLGLRRGHTLVLTTGGTGVGPRDHTADVTEPLLERTLPGISEAIRAVGIARGVPTSILSRGVAGVVGEALVVNLPGSSGAVRDGLDVLATVLPHVVEQVSGGAAGVLANSFENSPGHSPETPTESRP